MLQHSLCPEVEVGLQDLSLGGWSCLPRASSPLASYSAGRRWRWPLVFRDKEEKLVSRVSHFCALNSKFYIDH